MTEPIAEVHHLLSRVESEYLGRQGAFDKIRSFTFENGNALLEFKSGKLIYLYNGVPENIDGVHGGLYSTGALFVANTLLRLNRISPVERDAFSQWWREEDKSIHTWRLAELKRKAEALGYTLTKIED